MTATLVQLDKSVETKIAEGYGAITIRVVVLDAKMAAGPALDSAEEAPKDATPDEMLPETDKRPVSPFLEEPKRGRQVCVFLINGQRQHAWDSLFIVRDLELKYLRNRMLVIVDCDGLKPEAVAELMQGSRHQFYEGKVYAALEARVIATLKGDPDLKQLEEEAEDEIANLEAGDEAVKAALDQLIESHHESAEHTGHGHAEAGQASRQEGVAGLLDQTQDVVGEGDTSLGVTAKEPVLQLRPDVATIRLKANEKRRLLIVSKPEGEWKKLETMALTLDPPVKELEITRSPQANAEEVTLKFAEAEDFDEDEYPIETMLRTAVMFSGHPEPRLLERRVVILPKRVPPGPQPPRPPKPLLDDPTFVRVTSRQPIKIVIGGPDIHVKLRWDGRDELLSGNPPDWSLHVRCESPGVEPQTFLTKPEQGRFELLVTAAPGLRAGEQLKFDVEAQGPGKTLSTAFLADVVESPSARRYAIKLAGGGQRRPPYELKYLKEKDWATAAANCFGEPWNGDEPGSFEPPNAKSPLTIFINQDTDLLTNYRDKLLAKKLTELTIQQRVNKYTAHVAFHLYQMYETQKRGTALRDMSDETPVETLMREEIQRVAQTLIRLMEVTQ